MDNHSLETLSKRQNRPILSIIIPTRNRDKYATKSLLSILEIGSDNLEIVVSDNSDNTELEKQIAVFGDKRVKYSHIRKKLSFIENFNQALANASGEYLCIIGDDDGVNPEIVTATEWAKLNNIDAIRPGLQAQYLWPGVEYSSRMKRKDDGRLSITQFKSFVRVFNPKTELLRLLKNGGLYYYTFGLPKLYHGIVKKQSLEMIRKATGQYFGGLTPDIYVVTALAIVLDKVVSIDYPLTIPGACSDSGSIASRTGRHTGSFRDAPHLENRGEYEWANEVPKFYSVETIWSDSIIAALKDFKRFDLIDLFNVEKLVAYCLVRYPKFKTESFQCLDNVRKKRHESTIQSRIKLINSMVSGQTLSYYRKLYNRLRRLLSNEETISIITNLPSIYEATNSLKSYLVENGRSFQEVIENYERDILGSLEK